MTAYDNNNTSLFDEVEVEVFVSDVNDNRPLFSSDQYVADVVEGNYSFNNSVAIIRVSWTIRIEKVY